MIPYHLSKRIYIDSSLVMVQCKTVISVIGFIVLLFFGIPIRVDPPHVPHNETIILFNNFIEQYNKSYGFNDTLRSQKFEAFQVHI